MPSSLVAAAQEAARAAGVSFSAWVSGAVDQRLRLLRMSDAIAAYEAEHGEITGQEMVDFEAAFGAIR